MDLIKLVFDLALNVDQYLAQVIKHYGELTYVILFVVIFIETGLVVVPFLPGDSLLFAAGAFAALGHFNPFLLFAVLVAATVLGDTVNFSIGRRVGRRAARSRWIKPEHLERTHAFFERHGRKTIFLARFVPIVRTGAPFVAGLSETPYRFFLLYNVLGAVAWVAIFVSLGYFFGSLPVVHDHFALAIGAVLVASGVPGVYEWWKGRRAKRKAAATNPSAHPPDRGGDG
ncbi:MAG TPA: VTT domain-containing protein [Thermoanaerobaculales bacterium]|nr:VTT domain-containing protein [Thermoanaerobaculales bacterium]HPA81059.1 VTT domain-containing protein [Thermoanaerobaculales bacterium]HQL29319.1 VTT domain-containing protein [Thermoanaerobaculales bacterium]HQN96333.1 VTT domain-containing protein [Thermoanaerobaculales bacterium]HQP44441.1 VTT domain-containing protein [Thermoanaerobaculales bacterium]